MLTTKVQIYYGTTSYLSSATYLVLLDELLILEHVSDSGRDGGLLPGLEGLGCVLDSDIELGSGCLGNSSDEGLGSLNILYLRLDKIFTIY